MIFTHYIESLERLLKDVNRFFVVGGVFLYFGLFIHDVGYLGSGSYLLSYSVWGV